jgi:hypothetical protein
VNFGKIIGEADTSYHGTDAVSHSKLEVYRRRPALYKKQFLDKTVEAPASSAFTVGRAAHCLVFEADTYATRFTVRPQGIDRRTKDGKAAWEQFVAANAGKEILDSDEAHLVQAMRDAVFANPTAALLLAGGESEVTWRAAGPAGMTLQCRTDRFNAAGCELTGGRPYVVDLKTVETLDAGEFRSFERSFWSLGYHRQAGFYLPLLQDCGVLCWDWFFVVVEKQEPFGCVVYRPTEDAVSCGIDETVRDLTALAQSMTTGVFPNLPAGVQEISLPSWYSKNAA